MSLPAIENAEHIDPATTGDNIAAKKVAPYQWDGANWQRPPASFVDKAYDYIGFSNADVNGNYQTIVFNTGGSGGSPVRTLALTYDGNNNVTSIGRS
jgi:hypothetical protein